MDLSHRQFVAVARQQADQRPLRVDHSALLEVHRRNEHECDRDDDGQSALPKFEANDLHSGESAAKRLELSLGGASRRRLVFTLAQPRQQRSNQLHLIVRVFWKVHSRSSGLNDQLAIQLGRWIRIDLAA